MKWLLYASMFLLLFACQSTPQNEAHSLPLVDSNFIDSTIIEVVVEAPPPPPIKKHYTPEERDSILKLHDTTLVNLGLLDSSIVMDLRYATTNNFMELQIYDCPKCFVRLKPARALLELQKKLKDQGLGLKMYDCFRPTSAQWKLWQKKPDPRFVAHPKKGSMHSRGGAVDVTLVQLNNHQELDMGTAYDYFGVEAYWSYRGHSDTVQQNRKLLLHTMEEYGFKTVTTEWWHYSYRRGWYKLSNEIWECEEN